MLSPAMEEAIEKVTDACEICAKNGRLKAFRKISLTHVNEAFNQELQIDFMFFSVKTIKRTVINMTNTGTGYSEVAISSDRSMDSIIRLFETVWIHNHGTPIAVSADEEYNRKPFRKYSSPVRLDGTIRPASWKGRTRQLKPS